MLPLFLARTLQLVPPKRANAIALEALVKHNHNVIKALKSWELQLAYGSNSWHQVSNVLNSATELSEERFGTKPQKT